MSQRDLRAGKSGWCLVSVNDCDGCRYAPCTCTCHPAAASSETDTDPTPTETP